MPERGAIGGAVGRLIDEAAIELVTDFHTLAVDREGDHVVLRDGDREIAAHEVIATTGFRPDLSIPRSIELVLPDGDGIGKACCAPQRVAQVGAASCAAGA